MSARAIWILSGIVAVLALLLHVRAGWGEEERTAEIGRLTGRIGELNREIDRVDHSLRIPSEPDNAVTKLIRTEPEPGAAPAPTRNDPPSPPTDEPSTPPPKPGERPFPSKEVLLDILAKYATLVEEGKYAELYSHFTEDFRLQLMFSLGITSAEDFTHRLEAMKGEEPFVFQGLALRLNPKVLSTAPGWGVIELDSPFSGRRDTWYLIEDEEGWKLAAAAESPTAEVEFNEASARLVLNLLAIAQLRFAETDPDHDGPDFASSADELGSAPALTGGSPLIPADLAGAATGIVLRGGYLFGPIPLEADGAPIASSTDFAFWAAPVEYGRTGRKIYITRRGSRILSRDAGGGAPVGRWPGDPKSPEGWGDE